MARIAFIGLSGPMGYDYNNYQDKNSTIPNPILEAPLGLMVLYDKILFLHPSLCPKSMLDLLCCIIPYSPVIIMIIMLYSSNNVIQ
jgi:hypothetical protein